ncbi:MAG TPA: hypothetical protein DGT23_29885 [Micromonosporaceae bacterium]|nr:hypothetical protein [Micromonosporaceae bacterium]
MARSGLALAEPTPAPGVPNPGGGVMPPGEVGEKVLLLLQWVAGLATAACVGGLLYAGGKMAIAHRRGDETNIAQLGWVLFACLLIGSASAIVAALL